MRPEEGDAARLWDMLQHARAIQALLAGASLDTYLADVGRRLQVERRLEIIGEAARQVSQSYKKSHPEVPWAGIIGLRNVLAHEYAEIDDERVWNIVTTGIPALVTALAPLVPPVPPDPEPEP